MKRFLCPAHAHKMKVGARPVLLNSANCSICRWEGRRWTLGDFADEFQDIAEIMRVCQEDPEYDSFGFSYSNPIEDVIKQWVKMMHIDYRRNFLKALNELDNK